MRPWRHIALVALAVTLLLAMAGAGAAQSTVLNREIRLQAMKAVVQLGPIVEISQNGKSELRTLGWGSGTIISADGLILTNYHVANVSQLAEQLPPNAQVIEDRLAVFITTRSDRPPTLTYIADVVAAAPDRDLAVLRISSTLDGKEVDWDRVRLPYVALGDSDQLEPGDPIYIFGYPGIGGNTITFTSGVVSGFTAEKGLGNRAWIKTDAAISGGNSGGTGLDDSGALVGVPTEAGRGGTQADEAIVDCRPLADSNGDGYIDDSDACVPVGGFINALRPVALALPVIKEAIAGPQARPTPRQTPVSEGVQVSGVILDADTGRPLRGAAFVVLQPGITYEAWESEDEVYTWARADSRGRFVLPDPLPIGYSYTLVVGLEGYETVWEDDVLVDEDAGPAVEITVRLQRIQ